MSDEKTPQRALLDDWLRLQQKVVLRTSEYVQNLGELVGQGSFEPREYIEESAKAWAGLVGDFGDWLKPETELPPGAPQTVVGVCRGKVNRGSDTDRIRIEIPDAIYGKHEGEKALIQVSPGPLIRRVDLPGRPPSVLEPGKHLALAPNPLPRQRIRDLELKFFSLKGIGQEGVYEGVVWVTAIPDEGPLDRERWIPAAVVVVQLV